MLKQLKAILQQFFSLPIFICHWLIISYNLFQKLIKEKILMSFWVFNQNSGIIYFPVVFQNPICNYNENFSISTTVSENKVRHNYEKKDSIKLNISKQDLIQAGYNCQRRVWNDEQDKKLLDLIKSEGKNWEEISKKMKDRNSKMCYSRYRRLSYETQKRWSSLQQKIILDCVQKNGFNWKLIAENLAGRTARQIKQHYQFCLQPNLDKSSWTLEEDLLLIQLLQKYGDDWIKIAYFMGNRTQNQIKNRYFGRLLKLSKQNNLANKLSFKREIE